MSTTTRPTHGGYPDRAPELRGMREMDERMISDLVSESYSLKRRVAAQRRGIIWRDDRIRTLESENANLRNRADNASHNCEALQEQINVLREALEEFADHGIRCDLNPTANFSDPVAVYQSLTSMLKFADGVVRSIASTALAQCEPPTP